MLRQPVPAWDRPPLPFLCRLGKSLSRHATSEGRWAPGRPHTPAPACRCPRSAPPVPAPAPHTDSPAVAGPESGAERGPRSRARRMRQPPLPLAKLPPALGRRPARRLSVPLEGVGCCPFSKVFWTFLCPPPQPHFLHHMGLLATSLWISAVMSLLFI